MNPIVRRRPLPRQSIIAPAPSLDVTVTVTSLGSATSVDITPDYGPDSEIGVGLGTYTLTGYTAGGADVTVTVADNADPACNDTDVVSLPSGCPPANDACVNAFSIGPGVNETGNTDNATNVEGLAACSGGGGYRHQ